MTESSALPGSRPGYRFLLAGAEFAWLHPTIALAFSPLPEFIPPDPAIVCCAFGIACLGSGLLAGRGLRRIVLLVAQALLLGIDIVLALADRYGNPLTVPPPQTFMAYFELAFVIGWAVWAWRRATLLMGTEISPAMAGNSLDRGVGMLLAVALIGWGLRSPVPELEKYVILLFVAGAGAMLASNRTDEDGNSEPGEEDSPRHPLAAILAGAAGIVLSLCIAIWIFGTPGIGRAARGGLDLLGKGFSAIILRIVALFSSFSGLRSRMIEDSEPNGIALVGSDSSGAQGRGNPLLAMILLWGLRLAILAAIVLLAAATLPPLWRWLLGRPQGVQSVRGGWLTGFRAFLARIAAWLSGMTGILGDSLFRSASPATRAYRRLLRWGRVAGCGCRRWETPLEYGSRISFLFPDIASKALLVARLFSEECYGRKSASASPDRTSGNSARTSGNSTRASVGAGRDLARAGARLSSPRRRILWMRLRNLARRLARKLGRKS
jgi:hypothetical protein